MSLHWKVGWEGDWGGRRSWGLHLSFVCIVCVLGLYIYMPAFLLKCTHYKCAY